MKKIIIFCVSVLIILAIGKPFLKTGGGDSFIGGFAGGTMGSVVGSAMTRPRRERVVVVKEERGHHDSDSVDHAHRRINRLDEKMDRINDKLDILIKKLDRLAG